MKDYKELFKVEGLKIRHKDTASVLCQVDRFSLFNNEILGLFGPSGIGKSLFLKTIAGLSPGIPDVEIKGKLTYYLENGQVEEVSFEDFSSVVRPSYKVSMITQEPMASLDPRRKVIDQISPLIKLNNVGFSVFELLNMVGLTPDDSVAHKFPFELSGGQAQRVSIACAIAAEAKVILCDEPTSSLDVLQRQQFVDTVKLLNEKYQASWVIVSHDKMLLNMLCNRVEGWAGYNSDLLLNDTPASLSHWPETDLLELISINRLTYDYIDFKGFKKRALENINISIANRGIYGLTGPSGCGKTTLGKIISGILTLNQGDLYWRGSNVKTLTIHSFYTQKSKFKYVYQDSFEVLNPALSVLQNLFNKRGSVSRSKYMEDIFNTAQRLGIDIQLFTKYPSMLSGGERQRINILSALLTPTELLVLDEPLSGIDIEEKQKLMKWLVEVFITQQLTVLWISHDIVELTTVCNYIFVMNNGCIKDKGEPDYLLNASKVSETRAIVDASFM